MHFMTLMNSAHKLWIIAISVFERIRKQNQVEIIIDDSIIAFTEAVFHITSIVNICIHAWSPLVYDCFNAQSDTLILYE